MRSTPRPSMVITCLAVLTARGAAAQRPDPATSHPGVLTVAANTQLGPAVTPATERAAAFAAADAVVAVLRRDDAIAKPVGYSVRLIPVAGMTGQTLGGPPLSGSLHFGVTGKLVYFAMGDDGRGGRSVTDQGGLVDFSVIVNAPGRPADAEELTTEPDHGPSVLSNIRQTGQFRGHPIYNGECVVVSGHAAPPFVPLTMERYQKLVILGYRADSVQHAAKQPTAAQMQAYLKGTTPEQAKAMEAVMRSGPIQEGLHLKELQSSLDALTPAERRAPVAVTMHHVDWDIHGDDLADITDTSSAPLVQLNPAFMDRTRPPAAPQVITVCIPSLQGLENMLYDRLAEGPERESEKRSLEQRTRDAVRIRDHLDWPALEAMVKP